MNKPLLILFILIGGLTFGQNLVPNPSFEDTVYCPMGTNNPQALATWFNPTLASPDYYNACANNGGGVPSNDWGYQEAQDGNAYMGLGTYFDHPTVANYREYLEIELFNSLEGGKTYYWCMYVSLLDSTNLASNNIGISLTTDMLTAPLSEEMLVTPVSGNVDNVISNNISWTQTSGSFIATGGEKFLTIGNFYSNQATDFIQVQTGSMNGESAYYYIDNVYLGLEPCVETLIDMPNVFTPNNDGINDVLTFVKSEGLFDYTITILNRWGNRVYFGENEFQWDGTSQNSEPVADGTYFYTIEYNSKEVKNGFVQVVR